MPKAIEEDSSGSSGTWIQAALHDLCQPMTALQCRLSLSTLTAPQDAAIEVVELRQAIQDALLQCERMIVQVRMMQMKTSDRREAL